MQDRMQWAMHRYCIYHHITIDRLSSSVFIYQNFVVHNLYCQSTTISALYQLFILPTQCTTNHDFNSSNISKIKNIKKNTILFKKQHKLNKFYWILKNNKRIKLLFSSTTTILFNNWFLLYHALCSYTIYKINPCGAIKIDSRRKFCI